MTMLTVAALQLAFSDDIDANIAAVSELVRPQRLQPADLCLVVHGSLEVVMSA